MSLYSLGVLDQNVVLVGIQLASLKNPFSRAPSQLSIEIARIERGCLRTHMYCIVLLDWDSILPHHLQKKGHKQTSHPKSGKSKASTELAAPGSDTQGVAQTDP